MAAGATLFDWPPSPSLSMSAAAGRRKRAAPKVNVPPAPVPVPVPVVVAVPEDPLLRAAQAAGVLLISQAQESMAQRERARPIDPPLTTISANEVTTAVAARMRTQLPPDSTTKQSVRRSRRWCKR